MTDTTSSTIEKKMTTARLVGVAVLIVVAVFAYQNKPAALGFKPAEQMEIMNMIPALLLASMFLERAIEVFLSAWRGGGADVLDSDIAYHQKEIDTLEQIAPEQRSDTQNTALENEKTKLGPKITERVQYRADSRFIAQWMGLGMGIVIALVGVRVLNNLVDTSALEAGIKPYFVTVDVLLTGALLAGGSDAINKIMKLYSGYMSMITANTQAPKPKPPANGAG